MSRESPFADFASGTAILSEGGAARAMYIIESGRVEVSRGGIVLGELGPGEVFGEMALLQEQPHSANVVAKTAVRALEIDHAAFHAVLRENPEVAVRLMRQMVLRLQAGEQRRIELERQLAEGGGARAPKPFPAAHGPAPATAAPAAAAAPVPAAPGAALSAPATPASPAPPPAAAPSVRAPQPAATPERVAAKADGHVAAPAASAAVMPPAAAPPVSAPRPAAPPPAPSPPAATPRPVAAPAAAPSAFCIVHAQGRIALAGSRGEWLVGRPDPATGQVPEIDLGMLDVARSLSRRHARLREESGRITLREEPGVANGTWVNGERLQAGAAVALAPGDRLRFGAVEVEFAAR